MEISPFFSSQDGEAGTYYDSRPKGCNNTEGPCSDIKLDTSMHKTITVELSPIYDAEAEKAQPSYLTMSDDNKQLSLRHRLACHHEGGSTMLSSSSPSSLSNNGANYIPSEISADNTDNLQRAGSRVSSRSSFYSTITPTATSTGTILASQNVIQYCRSSCKCGSTISGYSVPDIADELFAVNPRRAPKAPSASPASFEVNSMWNPSLVLSSSLAGQQSVTSSTRPPSAAVTRGKRFSEYPSTAHCAIVSAGGPSIGEPYGERRKTLSQRMSCRITSWIGRGGPRVSTLFGAKPDVRESNIADDEIQSGGTIGFMYSHV